MKKGLLIILLLHCIAFSSAQEQTVLQDSTIALALDKQIPLEERIEILANSVPRRQEIVDACRLLLEEARDLPDKKYMLRLFRVLILNLRMVGPQQVGNAYADSVLLYINKVSDPGEIGMAYSQLSAYHINDYATCHSYRYKAIPYLEKSPEYRYRIAELYYYTAADYYIFNDYDNIKKNGEKLFELYSKYNIPEALVFAYCIKSGYFSLLYELDESVIAIRDSSSFYAKKAVEEFEKISYSPSKLLHDAISGTYHFLAFLLYLENTPKSLEKALEYNDNALLYDTPDLLVIARYHNVRGNIFLRQGKLKEAEKEAQTLLNIFSRYENDKEFKDDFVSEYRQMYELLVEISEAKGNYKEALEYNRLLNELLREIFDKERYEAVESVKTQYEVSKKEDEIVRLTYINRFQKRIVFLYLVLGILSIIGLSVFIYLLLLKRKNVVAQLKIAQLEKNEAEAQILLKEEILKRSELEKYEALLDIHFKEQELTEQERELELLFRQKEELVEQILEQAKKIEKFETPFEQIQTKLNSRSLPDFLEEMKQIIRKKLSNNSHTRAYLQNIDKIDDAMLLKINSQFEGNLALVHIRYCVCFIIGMSIKDIADCLNVEVSSVHTTRHRLKRRLKLDTEDLDIYFKSLLSD